MGLYGPRNRELQERFDTRRLADRLEERVVRETIDADDRAFIEAREMFFLATADSRSGTRSPTRTWVSSSSSTSRARSGSA